MILESLTLQNFRSYKKATFQFSPETILIIGPNTAGKTNILEGVMMMATGKSFRADADREAIRWGSDIGRVTAEIRSGAVRGLNDNGRMTAEVANENFDPSSVSGLHPPYNQSLRESEAGQNFVRSPRSRGEQTKLEFVLTNGEVGGQKAPALTAVRRGWPLRKYLVNGVPRRMIDFVGNLRAVLFWPEHLELVTDSPSLRRKYLDSVLIQVDREYRRNLLSYERGLRQRNRLLDLINEGKAHRHQLLFWDQLLIKAGGYLTDKRAQYLDFINEYRVSPRKGLGQTSIDYRVEYDKSVISESRLEQYKEEEVAAKATLVGPHRDNFVIAKSQIPNPNDQTRGKAELLDLSKYGSRGEQRLAVIWLKLAELLFIEQKTGDRPILLLDDIFSELDDTHRKLVIELIGRQQTIVTSADRDIIHIIPTDTEVVQL
ncbi:AAA family ATPase [Candidatus Gottesmanbacteria bacterium]|nr:AAA family ATPase [Candidatus Gottesmanbacteria bacterium]